MFGAMPPLPRERIEALAGTDTDRLRRQEDFRAHAFGSGALGPKTVQLVCLALLLVSGSGAAPWHVLGARRAGASEDELRDLIDLVAAVSALKPLNLGYIALKDSAHLDNKRADK